ncbi:hypothetical protein [Sphingobacterium yanglingense]|uniref:Beta-galactosidase-like protein n=1 Tax=Sphingobacterium yanglingense TaxID=1437280 RepID=A0A4R6WP34_9SPHI|nr:hypothetical protein [Sphingobacterium yanglingense]TDQ80165.1 hypothetical protein CLV99_1621 [Sphingobacterium yanglingense]
MLNNKSLYKVVLLQLLCISAFICNVSCNAKDKITEPESTKKTPVVTDNDPFLIGIYVAPPKEFTTDVHYKAIADANINLIQDISAHYTVADKRTMLTMAAKHNIKMIVADNRMNLAEKDIQALIADYRDFESTIGYYIKDEPVVNELQDAAFRYKRVLEASPASIPHVNLFPSYATGALGSINYEKEYVEKLINLIGANNLKYLSFDNYPFLENDVLREDPYYHDLDVIRRMGLKYKVKTSAYLQSIGTSIGIRRPNANELRYSAYTNLAYGIKLPVWFTYWTPAGGGTEKFTSAIVDLQGNKTDLYPSFAQINKEMMQIGPELLKMDAINVYHVGTNVPRNTVKYPESFPLICKQPDKNILVTEFVNAKDKTTYIMVVNKSLHHTESLSFQVKASGLSELSKQDGRLRDIQLSNSSFQTDFLPGEGKLFKLN